jgi:hypothetical protein
MTITNRIDAHTVKQNIDLRDVAGRYTELRKASGQRELCGPCPKCGGDDRFHVADDWFFCRQCHEKRGDAIEFTQWLNGCDFKEAVATLTGAAMPTPATRRTPTTKRPTEQPEDWQRNATTIVDNAHARLFNDSDIQAEAGRAYLDSRAIEPHAWQAFKLGYKHDAPLPGTEGKQRAPAIVIPWYKGGKLCAIRYRFLQWHEYTDSEGKQRREKQTALPGSGFAGVLYGGQALDLSAVSLSTLVICEGELNACSIWQAAKDSRADVLSLGSESATITAAMQEYAGRYATTIIWLDREERAQAFMAALPGTYGIKSPNGQDANDLLQAETLGGFLALHRFQAAKNRHEQERVLWDLWDAAQVWPGADASTNEVMRHIAKVLEITLEV